MTAIDDKEPSNVFITDIECILNDIQCSQKQKQDIIAEHFKNIASNPEHTYKHEEQIAILLEIMKCYNTNIREYQKNIRELSIIAKNLIKAHNERFESDDRHSSDETIPTRNVISLYDYFMQTLWGSNTYHFGVKHSPDYLANVAKESITLQRTQPGKNKKRNTIHPIIKHIPHM